MLIASNKNYDLRIDQNKNRAYLTINGFWRNIEEVPNYLDDWKKTLLYLKKGFTLLTDASNMKSHPADVKELHLEAQKLITKAGVAQVAEVLDDIFAIAQLNVVSQKSTMPRKAFKTKQEAENFLDEVQSKD